MLRAFLAGQVLPRFRAGQRALYRAARRDPGISLLVRALVSEHRDLASVAGKLGEPQQPAAAAAQAAAAAPCSPAARPREDSPLLPAPERSGTDLAAVLAREPRLAGGHRAA